MGKCKFSELCFLIYWSIMLFVKAMGWYDGQNVYKVFLVIAIVFWAVKMVTTQYSLCEYALIIFLVGFSGLIYFVSREKGAAMCIMLLLGVKDVDIKRMLKVGIWVWGATFFSKFLINLAFLGNVETALQLKNVLGYVIRYFMGYSHPNVLHISYFMFATLLICYLKERLTLKITVCLMAFNILLFLYSYSLTGFGVTTLYILGAYYVHDRKLRKWEQVIVQIVFPAILCFSFVLPIALSGGIFEKADWLLNNRVAFAQYYLKFENMHLLGNNIAQITDSINTMDNSFVFILVIYGVPLFILFCVGYLFLIHKQCKRQENVELVTTLCILFGGITEPYILNTSFKNISLIFLGGMLFEVLERNRALSGKQFALIKVNKDVKIFLPEVNLRPISINSNKWILLAASLILTVGYTVWYVLTHEVEYDIHLYMNMWEMIRSVLTFATISTTVLYILFQLVLRRKKEG